MVLNNEHSHFLLHKALHDKMSKIYIYQALLIFVKSLIGIFVPIYLYSIGFSLTYICIYLIGISLTYLLGIPIAIKIINEIGFKYTILLSIPFYILHLTSVKFIESNHYFFHISWLTLGIYFSLFWPAFHSEIAVSGNNKSRGSQIGTLQIITILFGSFAPLIGGFILQTTGYALLLFISSFLLLLGLFPLLTSKEIKIKKINFKYYDYIRFIKDQKKVRAKQAFKAEGIDSFLTFTFWPIVLFILLNKNFLNLGTLLTSVSLISVIFIFYYKSFFDRTNKQKALKFVSSTKSINWFLRTIIILFGTTLLYFVESLYKLIHSFFTLSFQSIFYNNATKENYLSYIVFRDFYLHTAKITFALLIICSIYFLGETKELFIFATFFGILAPVGLSKLKEE